MEEIQVTTFNEGESIFESHGTSKVKVTKNGEAKTLILKIKSTGVADLIDTFSRKAPSPPVKRLIIDPNKAEDKEFARELGLNRKKHIESFDLTDSAYIEAKKKHEEELGLAILLQGLDVEFKDRQGNTITDADEKIKILKGQGMTGEQFMQVIDDIQNLTKWAEEKTEDFFDKS